MMGFFKAIAVVSAVMFSQLVAADLVIEVTDWVKDPTKIAIVPFRHEGVAIDQDMAAVVAADLTRSGQFEALPRDAMYSSPSARRNMVALVSIRMVPTGELVAVTVTQSSGNEAFDQSAILAVQKAGRFAFMQGMPSRLFETHFREFTFRFSPEDLRL